MIELLILLLVAGTCGAVGQSLTGYSRTGCLGSIILGFIGGLLGTWLARQFGLPLMLTIGDFPVVWSVIGAALFVAVLSLISGRRPS